MNIDFKLIDSGDIAFEKKEYTQPLKLSFNVSKTKVMKISFDFKNIEDNDINGLKISFSIKEEEKNNIISTVSNNEEISQRLLIDIKTIIGDIPYRKEIGTNICEFKHEVFNKNMLYKIKNLIENKAKNYFDNPIVDVSLTAIKNNSYCQIVNILVFNNYDLILDYDIRE